MSVHSSLSGLEVHEAYQYVQESDPGAVGAKLYWLQVSTGVLKRRNDANSAWVTIGGTGGPFKGLSDVPSSYAGQAGKIVAVKGDETGLEFIPGVSASVPDWVTGSVDTPPGSPNTMDDEFTSSATLPGGGSAKWTWDNQSTATVTIFNASMLKMAVPLVSGNAMRIIYQTLPLAPYEFVIKVTKPLPYNTNFLAAGIALWESSSDKRLSITTGSDTGDKISVFAWSSTTTISAAVTAITLLAPIVYLKVALSGSTLTLSYSLDGLVYGLVLSEALTTHFTTTPNRIGVFVNGNTAAYTGFFHYFRRTI